MHVGVLERERSTLGNRVIASEKVLRRIAKTFSSNEQERAEIERKLLFERVKAVSPKEVREYLEQEQRGETFVAGGGASMPPGFIARLRKDLKKQGDGSLEQFASGELDAVLEGKHVLNRQRVIALALAMKQPVDQYLVLAEYMPQYLKNLMKTRGGAALRNLQRLSPEDLHQVLEVIEKVVQVVQTVREKKEHEAYERGTDKGPGP
jgi:hypothetical protein